MGVQETALDRLRIVMGDEALQRVQAARVLVLGLGGVGSNCAEALARGGVGELVLLDRDVVAPSNLNRQAVAYHSTLGQAKTEVMKKIVLDINPECKVTTVHTFLPREGGAELLSSLPRPDYVVDAIDTVSQKLVVAKWCQEHAIPEISSMGGANKIDPSYLRFAHIEKTSGDRLCRIMRKECKRRGIKKLEVLYSNEPKRQIFTDSPERDTALRGDGAGHKRGAGHDRETAQVEKGSILGTMSYMPPIMGMMIAGRVIRDIAGLKTD